MTSTLSSLRTLRALALGLCLVAPVVAGSGCQSGLLAMDPRAAAMAALSESIKQSVRTYLAGLEGVVRELGDVRDLPSAMKSADKLAPYVDDVLRTAPELRKLSGKDLENLRLAFGPELEKAAKDFEFQAERLSGSGALGSIMKNVLDRIQPVR